VELRKLDCEARAGLLIDNPKAQTVLKSLAVMAGDKLEKGMWTVSSLACLIGNLFDIQQSTECEAAYEGDGSILPDELKDSVKALGEILLHMVAEECEELYGPEAEPEGDFDSMVVAMAESIAGLKKTSDATLEKVGAKHSSATMAKLQDMHDTLSDMTAGTVCEGTDKAAKAEALTKTETAHKTLHETQTALAKVTAEREDFIAKLEKADEALKSATAEIERLKKEPERGGPLRAGLHVVGKVDDIGNDTSKGGKETPTVKVTQIKAPAHDPEAARAMVKAAMAGGGQPFVPLS
jgi:hypothetical protein